jgi:hypothetical protein
LQGRDVRDVLQERPFDQPFAGFGAAELIATWNLGEFFCRCG